eukprot:TRINITY_DN975_c0_g3_i1.p1 TRINITY_DN975_c0_g3~~TRINITY_DN975_c0_g3_i1.p1  ORF type:complete len:205 (+),score=71.61 TRINITY_DN975_c0_g3_i1:94-708(+)
MSVKIAVVYYSTWGHVATLAQSIVEGLKKNADVTVDIYQIKETLSEEILSKMHAPPKADVPVVTPDTLLAYDGVIFGIPTRYGNMPAQFKTFFDSTGHIWQTGGYQGKMAAIFQSTASLGGGQETTALTTLTVLSHLGMIFVPFGFACAFADQTNLTEVHGGSAYGAGTLAGGDGSRQVSDLEKRVGVTQGEYFAKTVVKHFKH